MTKVFIDKALLEQAINTLGYYASVCGEDDQDTPAKQAQTALRAAQAEPAVGPVAKAMTAHRAAYFMERFKKEEKLLGPNEQAAVDFVIDMLTATHAAPPPPAELEALRASHGQALRLLTQKEKDRLGRRAEGMDGNEWDTWVQGKFAQVNGLIVQGGSYE